MTDAQTIAAVLAAQQRRRADPYESQRRYGETVMQNAMTPSQSWGEALAKALTQGVGGYFAGDADRRADERDRTTLSDMSDLATATTNEELRAKVEKIRNRSGGTADMTVLGPMIGQILSKNQEMMHAAEQGRQFGVAHGRVPTAPSIQGAPLPALAPQQANDQAQKHIQYLVNVHNFTPQQAANAVGHLFQESGFNPGAVGDQGTAHGMGQWRLDRQAALRQQAQASGQDVNSPTTQLDFFANELKTRPEWQQFQGDDPKQQQAALMAYFRPAGYTPQTPEAGHGYAQRVQYGQQFAQAGNPSGVMQGDNPGPMPTPAAGNSPPDVPRPQPTAEQIQRLQQQVATKQMTVAQAEQRLADEINHEWQVQRETRRMTWQSEQEDRRMKEKADIDLRQNAPMALIKGRMDDYEKTGRPKGVAAVNDVMAIHQARQLMDAGAFTGTGAEAKLWLAKLGEQFGIPSSEAANTQVLMSSLANRVLAGMGGSLGSGVSNADVKFFEMAKGGKIDWTEKSLRQLLDVGEREGRRVIQNHAEEVRRLRGVRGVSDALGHEYFALPDAPQYDAWNKANPLQAPQPAPQAAPPQATQQQGGEFVPQMQPNGFASHPNPNAPTNMSPHELQGAQTAAPRSKEEFDALPSGTVFTAPDGSRRVKP